MVQTLQGREQEFYRSVTGATSGTWEQNALDAWEAMGITLESTFNGSYIKYLQTLLNSDLQDLTGLIALRRSRFGNNYPEFGAVSGQAAWLAADAIPLGAVASYTDPLGITYTQGTGSAQPINTANQIGGKPALVFDGSNDGLNAGSSSAINNIWTGGGTVFVVYKSAASGGRVIDKSFSGTQAGWRMLFTDANATEQDVLFEHDAASSVYGTISDNRVNVFGEAMLQSVHYNKTTPSTLATIKKNGETIAVSIIGAGSGAAVDDSARDLWIGNRSDLARAFTGAIAELLIYNRSLSTAEMQVIELYLANKYGITLA